MPKDPNTDTATSEGKTEDGMEKVHDESGSAECKVQESVEERTGQQVKGGEDELPKGVELVQVDDARADENGNDVDAEAAVEMEEGPEGPGTEETEVGGLKEEAKEEAEEGAEDMSTAG